MTPNMYSHVFSVFDNSYQFEFLFIQDNLYNDYRTVFLSFASSMDKNMRKWTQTETGSQTGTFTLKKSFD